jgi:excisionase family DNA binding protein
MECPRSENMTIGEAVRCFAIGRTKLYELIQNGDIEAFKLGRRTLVRTDSVRSFMDRLPRVSGVA